MLVIAVFATCAYIVLKGADTTMPVQNRMAAGPRLIMSMDGFRFTRSENGRTAWSMTAKSADLYENKEAQLKDVEIVFSSPSKKEAVLRGETATMDTTSGNASVRRVTRQVRVLTSDGYLLTSDSLLWKAGERSLFTSDPFRLLGKEIFLEGVGILANVDMSTIAVNGNVKAVLQE